MSSNFSFVRAWTSGKVHPSVGANKMMKKCCLESQCGVDCYPSAVRKGHPLALQNNRQETNVAVTRVTDSRRLQSKMQLLCFV